MERNLWQEALLSRLPANNSNPPGTFATGSKIAGSIRNMDSPYKSLVNKWLKFSCHQDID
jgi:hypothetical protein